MIDLSDIVAAAIAAMDTPDPPPEGLQAIPPGAVIEYELQGTRIGRFVKYRGGDRAIIETIPAYGRKPKHIKVDARLVRRATNGTETQ